MVCAFYVVIVEAVVVVLVAAASAASTAAAVEVAYFYNEDNVHGNTDWMYIERIKNGYPCIVEIRGTQGCALVGDPARAVGECRDVAKAQL